MKSLISGYRKTYEGECIKKICIKCKLEKPIDSFGYRSDKKKYRNVCKDCTNKQYEKWKTENDTYKNNRRNIYNKYKMKNEIKINAKKALNESVRIGTTIKPSKCELCNKKYKKSSIIGHHEDYKKALEVIWYCRKCHLKIHQAKRRNPG